MDYKEFKDVLKTKMEERFPDSDVEISQVVKNNDTVLDGMVIKDEGSNMTPNIYLNSFYEDFENGRSMENIADAIADLRAEHHVSQNFDISKIMDWNEAKDRICCKLINAEENRQFLADKPYTQVEDLAVVYQVVMENTENGSATVTIHDGIMENYGVDVEALHETALKNMDFLMPAKFSSMQAVAEEIMLPDMMREMGISEEEAREMIRQELPEGAVPMYVLTNESKVNGAACVLNPNVQEQITETLGGDYFVLPSSVHETLIIPKSADVSYRDLEAMVQEVNSTQVAPDEKLSDHVYEYDCVSKELMRSDTAAERKAERNQPQEKAEGQKSLKEKLEEKKVAAASMKKDSAKDKGREPEPAMG